MSRIKGLVGEKNWSGKSVQWLRGKISAKCEPIVFMLECRFERCHFYHCKYSQQRESGARIDDLYVVCGQAQRSVFWKADVIALLNHLRRREGSRQLKYGVSRFVFGDVIKLNEISRRAPYLIPEFKIFVVQPGYSKRRTVDNHLDLFAVTELYLQETYAIQFGVIANE